MLQRFRSTPISVPYRLLAALTVTLLAGQASATTCTCRPELAFDSSLAGGTCTKTQDNSDWCEIVWNGGTSSAQHVSITDTPGAEKPLSTHDASRNFVNLVAERGLQVEPAFTATDRPPSLVAADALFQRTPDTYNEESVRHKAVLMGSALLQFQPDQVGMALALYEAASDVVPAVQSSEPVDVRVGDYRGIASIGCIALFNSDFKAIVKTRFSPFAGDCEEFRK